MTTFANPPLSAIVPSRTNPRQHFDDAGLRDLAASIAASGVHTPVLVRPLPASRMEDTAHLSPRPMYELVAGERRYRASLLAKAVSIPAMVRNLDDTQVLEIQIIENLHRQDLTALEEAQGYETLMQHSGLTAEAVAEKIGKSRSHIFGRLKLLDAGQDVRDALRDGMIDATRALLLARIPSTLLQVKALKEILRPNHPEGVMPSRLAGEHIRKNYMLKIEQAPFDHTDGSLSPRACTVCPTRTGADQDIFADVMGADMCTDPSCYDNKVQQHHSRRRAQLEAAGHRIIDGDDAADLMPHANSGPEGYARLDDVRDSPTNKPLREELAKLLDKGEVVPVMIVNPHKEGDLLACVPEDQVPQLLDRAGRKKAAETLKAERQQLDEKRAKLDADHRETELRTEYETTWRERLLAAVVDGVGKEPEQAITTTQMRRLSGLLIDEIDQAVVEKLCSMLSLNASTDEDAGDMDPHEHALRAWAHIGNGLTPADTLSVLNAATGAHWYRWMESHLNSDLADEEVGHLLSVVADFPVDVEQIKADVKAEITARVTAEQTAAEAAKALLPLTPAAQANGVRGEAKGPKGKGKKPPAGASAKPAPLNAQEAMQGIAAAMQGQENGADSGPSDTNPGADAPGEGVGPAARPDGAPLTKVGSAWPFPPSKRTGP